MSAGLRVFLPFALARETAFDNSSERCLSRALKKSPEALIPFRLCLTADFTTSAISTPPFVLKIFDCGQYLSLNYALEKFVPMIYTGFGLSKV